MREGNRILFRHVNGVRGGPLLHVRCAHGTASINTIHQRANAASEMGDALSFYHVNEMTPDI